MSILSKIWEKSPKEIFTSIITKINTKKIIPVWTKVVKGPLKDHELLLDVNAFTGWNNMIIGDFDNFIYEKLTTCKDVSNSVFWDIGAHFGYHSLSFASIISDDKKVYSFEPNPYNADRLNENLQRNKDLINKVKINRLALSNADGEATFIFSKNVDDSRSSGSHLSGVGAPLSSDHYTNFQKVTVPTRKIDSLINDKVIEPAQIVKIDVEGAEMLVLEGGIEYFSKHKPLIFMEVHNITMMLEVSNYLHSIGYKLEMLDKESSTVSWCFIFASPIN